MTDSHDTSTTPITRRRGSSRWYAEWLDDPRVEELGQAMLHHAAELVSFTNASGEDRGALLDTTIDSLVAQRNGSTRIPAPEPIVERANAFPSILADTENAYRPLVLVETAGAQWLYHQRTLHYERALAARLRERFELDLPRPANVSACVREVAATPTRLSDGTSLELSEEQIAAVRAAAIEPLTVVTGGPGTGKTSIVVSLLRVLVRSGVSPDRIALAAPTGKAANKLARSIETQLASLGGDERDERLAAEFDPPRTLHRLLRYSGEKGQFRRDEDDPIPADWVIVDEASMIDLVLMERLARCLSDDARLVLLGDVEQLPSVETGTVLRDLIPDDGEGAEHIVRLRKSFRMDPTNPAGRAILRLADAVRRGDSEQVASLTSSDPVGVIMEDIGAADLRAWLLDFVDEWFGDVVTGPDDFASLTQRVYRQVDGQFTDPARRDIARLFAHFEKFRILCLTRVFATGAEALNDAFHLRMARRFGAEGIPDYLPGEPVMMLRNDYDRGLFNGDQGLLLRVDAGDDVRLAAVFRDRDDFRAHHLPGLRGQLAHAWAMTVHKSQGSEFDRVALILSEEEIPLLSRQLLYTGLTRARASVRIIGPAELFRLGVERAVRRWSGLGERLFADA